MRAVHVSVTALASREGTRQTRLDRFASQGALHGEQIPTALTSDRDTPLHAEASCGRGRGGQREGQRETEGSPLVPLALGHNHTQGSDNSVRDLVARGPVRACSQLQSSSRRTAGRQEPRKVAAPPAPSLPRPLFDFRQFLPRAMQSSNYHNFGRTITWN